MTLRSATQIQPQRRSDRVSWPDVLRCLGRDESRSYALDRIRDRGFSGSSCGDRFALRSTRDLVAGALTATEDWLELTHPRWPERQSIRDVRRRLEMEVA